MCDVQQALAEVAALRDENDAARRMLQDERAANVALTEQVATLSREAAYWMNAAGTASGDFAAVLAETTHEAGLEKGFRQEREGNWT